MNKKAKQTKAAISNKKNGTVEIQCGKNICIIILFRLNNVDLGIFLGNYGSRSKKGEFLRFELSHNALNRKPRKQ